MGFGAVKGGSDGRKGQPRPGAASAELDLTAAFSIPPGLRSLRGLHPTPGSPGTRVQGGQPRAGPGLKHLLPCSRPGAIAAGTSCLSCASGKGSASQVGVPAGDGSVSQTIPAAGTCWFPASAAPFSHSPRQADFGISSSFSSPLLRDRRAGQVSEAAPPHRAHHGWHRQAPSPDIPPSLLHALQRIAPRPPQREAEPARNPQTRQALNLFITELVGGGQGHAGGGPWGSAGGRTEHPASSRGPREPSTGVRLPQHVTGTHLSPSQKPVLLGIVCLFNACVN